MDDIEVRDFGVKTIIEGLEVAVHDLLLQEQHLNDIHMFLHRFYVSNMTDGVQVHSQSTMALLKDVLHQYTKPVAERGLPHDCRTCIFKCEVANLDCTKWQEKIAGEGEVVL